MKKIISILLLLTLTSLLWAEGQGEAAASTATRGKYLAGKGIIIPPEEVHINANIAHIDYNYPRPERELGVTFYIGHQQISARGQEEIIHIGIQGNELQFEDLPPMNLAFVIDKSGSMSDIDKMEWVKQSFEIFIKQVRDIDFISLIVFDDKAKVIFPTTQMNTQEKRFQFRQAVDIITPGGGTNLIAGLELGYEQVLANYREEYTNRVLFLTDGMGEATGILEMAETYKEMGINVSTIGVGKDFDVNLMVDLAKSGGEAPALFLTEKRWREPSAVSWIEWWYRLQEM